MFHLSKLIPIHIQIKTLYWDRMEKQMTKDLSVIFNKLDVDDYEDVSSLISKFHEKWDGRKYPKWMYHKLSEIYRAEAMYNILTSPFYEESSNSEV